MAIAMEDTVNPMQFTQMFNVTPEMIDDNHHFNNVWSVKWIQDIAIAHSESVGGTSLMKSLGAGWMIHVQHIEYKNQAFLGDAIQGTTWVAAYGKVACCRKCRFERISDGKVIFESETQWVLVDLNRGRPMAITDEMKKLYVEGV
jgi:acyl-CoA thioester hydrolase